MVESERHTAAGRMRERRYYITSVPSTEAASLLDAGDYNDYRPTGL